MGPSISVWRGPFGRSGASCSLVWTLSPLARGHYPCIGIGDFLWGIVRSACRSLSLGICQWLSDNPLYLEPCSLCYGMATDAIGLFCEH